MIGERVDIHLTQFSAPLLQEFMQQSALVPADGVRLSHLAENGLEVIAHVRHIVVVGHGTGLCLSHRMKGTIGVRAAMIHVIAGQVGTGTKLTDGQGLHLATAHVDTAVIGLHHAATQFTCQIGIRQILALHLGILIGTKRLGGDDR